MGRDRTQGETSDVAGVDAVTSRADDRGLLIGDGVFETMGVFEGRCVALDRHLRRLAGGLHRFGIDVEASIGATSTPLMDHVTRLAIETAAEVEHGRLRITVTGGDASGAEGRGPQRGSPPNVYAHGDSVYVTHIVSGAVPEVAAAIGRFTADPNRPSAGVKTISYADHLLARRFADACGAAEYLYFTPAGQLCEGTRSTVLLHLDGAWVTPGLGSGCLPGIGRAVLLDAGVVTAHDLAADDLQRADDMAIVSISAGLQRVTRIVRCDDHGVPDCVWRAQQADHTGKLARIIATEWRHRQA